MSLIHIHGMLLKNNGKFTILCGSLYKAEHTMESQVRTLVSSPKLLGGFRSHLVLGINTKSVRANLISVRTCHSGSVCCGEHIYYIAEVTSVTDNGNALRPFLLLIIIKKVKGRVVTVFYQVPRHEDVSAT